VTEPAQVVDGDVAGLAHPVGADPVGSSGYTMSSGSGRRNARIHTNCPVVAAPTLKPRVRQVVLHGRVRQAESLSGCLLRPGHEDRFFDGAGCQFVLQPLEAHHVDTGEDRSQSRRDDASDLRDGRRALAGGGDDIAASRPTITIVRDGSARRRKPKVAVADRTARLGDRASGW